MQHHRLKAKYEGQVLKPEHALKLPEGTRVILQALPEPPSDLTGLLTPTKVQAVYEGGVLRLRQPLKVHEGSTVAILALSPVRPLKSFQGLLQHLKEDSVTLQHEVREW